MVEVLLGRVVIRDGADRQYIYLCERHGKRGFPIVIGNNEAAEIQRVVHGRDTERPLTHKLAYSIVEALDTKLVRADITDLRNNTFFAQLVLQNDSGTTTAVIDARPSDAIALAMRAGCTLRVAEWVLERVRGDEDGPPDPLPPDAPTTDPAPPESSE